MDYINVPVWKFWNKAPIHSAAWGSRLGYIKFSKPNNDLHINQLWLVIVPATQISESLTCGDRGLRLCQAYLHKVEFQLSMVVKILHCKTRLAQNHFLVDF